MHKPFRGTAAASMHLSLQLFPDGDCVARCFLQDGLEW